MENNINLRCFLLENVALAFPSSAEDSAKNPKDATS